MAGYGTKHESAYYIDAAFRDYRFSNSTLGKRIRGRLSSNQQYIVGKEEENNIVVLASGNLGLISFTSTGHRLTLEEITGRVPGSPPRFGGASGCGFCHDSLKPNGSRSSGKEGEDVSLYGRGRG